jgi:hypothetical protein
MYLLVHKNPRAVNSDRELATILYTREILTDLTLASRGYINLYCSLAEGGPDFGFVTSLA